MIAAMSVLPVIAKEIRDAREQDRPVVHIRVTQDAIPGSVVTTPIAPERLRLLALTGLWRPEDDIDTVIADPRAQERWLEIVIHPADFAEVLKDTQSPDAVLNDVNTGGKGMRIYGVPVSHT